MAIDNFLLLDLLEEELPSNKIRAVWTTKPIIALKRTTVLGIPRGHHEDMTIWLSAPFSSRLPPIKSSSSLTLEQNNRKASLTIEICVAIEFVPSSKKLPERKSPIF